VKLGRENMSNNTAPLSDTIITALSRLIDDSQVEQKREPSHSDLDFLFTRVGLNKLDPRSQGQTVGKAKRVRAVLSGALEHNPNSGELLVKLLIDMIRGCGGFRPQSNNYVGRDSIETLRQAFQSEGYILSEEGEVFPSILDNLPEKEMTRALLAYARRARKGVLDAALLVGTGKDLLEAVAKHVLIVKSITIDTKGNFPFLLGQAFISLDMKTPQHKPMRGEPAIMRYERALFELGCSVNSIRNHEGTGHGRAFLPTISQEEAESAAQSIGIVADYMLRKLINNK